jgi:HD-GYP domain-containing protein (c-di-GMP phosphodiesterase class II)
MRHRFSSLRVRLLTLVALALVPALGLTMYNGVTARRQETERATADLLRLVHLAAGNQEALIEGARQLLLVLAQASPVRSGDAQECSQYLAGIQRQNLVYANIGVIALDGELICSALPASQPVSVADRPYFQDALQTRDLSMGDYQIGRVTGRAGLNLAYPVIGQSGEVQSVVFVALDLAWIDRLVREIQPLEGEAVLLISHGGQILARHPDPEQSVGQTLLDEPIVQEVLRGPTMGSAQVTDLDGVERLYAYMSLPGRERTGASLAVGVPVSVVSAEADQIFLSYLIAIVLLAVVVSAIGWVASDAFVLRPMNVLLAATRRLGAGELAARSGLDGNLGELGRLAQAFDQMAQALETREAERNQAQTAEHEQRLMAESQRDIVAAFNQTLDVDAVFKSILANVGQVVPLESASIMLVENGVARMARRLSAESAEAASAVLDRDMPLSEYPTLRKMAETGEPQVVSDTSACPDWVDIPETRWIRSYAGMPIVTKDRLVGFLGLSSANAGTYTEVHIDRLRALAGHAAIAIENARLFEARRRQAAYAEALAAVAARLNARLDFGVVLKAVCDAAVEVLMADGSAVALYDDSRDQMRLAAAANLPAGDLAEADLIPGHAFLEHVNGAGPVFALPDVQAMPGLPNAEAVRRLDIRSLAVAAMRREGRLVGSLQIFSCGAVRRFDEEDLALLKGMADQAAQAIVNARLYQESSRRLERLQSLRAVDRAITGSLNLQLTLNVLLEQVVSRLAVDAANVLLVQDSQQVLEPGASRGFRVGSLRQMQLRAGEGHAGRAVCDRRTVSVADLRLNPGDSTRSRLLAGDGFVSYHAVPLVAKGHVKGVLEVFHRSALDPEPEWSEYLETLANQAAIAIDNAALFDELQRSNAELTLAYDTTLEGWAQALDLRDEETEGHTRRVTELTVSLAKYLGIKYDELVHIRRGALLHDIGKMGIPDGILLKPAALSPDEWAIIRKHPEYAHDMLAPIAYLHRALDIPYCHHEKWDGTGYPRGLKGEQIPLAARIFAVVDVWDALGSDRPYRPAWPLAQVREYIRSQAGCHFDPKIVAAFLQMIDQPGGG